MPSEYDPLFGRGRDLAEPASDDLERVQGLFRKASRPYLSSPWSWLAWAVVLPAAALATRSAARGGASAVLLLWSTAILVGGGVELGAILTRRRSLSTTPLAALVLRMQGNLSLVGLALSLLLLWQDLAWALPGVWLLLLGHSFYQLGGLAFAPFRPYGLLYQLGGVAALWPRGRPLVVFAVVAFAANLWMAWAVARARATE
jgi:hypothetical protein